MNKMENLKNKMENLKNKMENLNIKTGIKDSRDIWLQKNDFGEIEIRFSIVSPLMADLAGFESHEESAEIGLANKKHGIWFLAKDLPKVISILGGIQDMLNARNNK